MNSSAKLGYVILYVEDVLKTVAFYQEAFGIPQRFLHESHQYAEMETGATTLAFASEQFIKESHQFRPNRKNELAAGAEIAFTVDDVEKQFQIAIDSGAVEVLKPLQKPWGQVVSYVRDNNGFIVEICSPVAK